MFRAFMRGDVKVLWTQTTNPWVTIPNLRRIEREPVAPVGTHPRPPFAGDSIARFREQALRLSMTLDEVPALAHVPAAVAQYLDTHQLSREAVCWPTLSARAASISGRRAS